VSEYRRTVSDRGPSIVGPIAVALALGAMIVIAMLVQAAGSAGRPLPTPPRVAGATATPRPAATPLPSTSPGSSAEPSADASAEPSEEPTESPSPGPTDLPTPPASLNPPPTEGPFAMNLYGDGDFMSQIDVTYSIAASMLTMRNIMVEGWDRRQATQRQYHQLARELSPQPLDGQGAEPEGWVGGLNELGFGPYELSIQPTFEDAVAAIARAIRFTGRPVGLLIWRGAHTWVVSGFEADADPAFTTEFQVNGLYIEDVWYPKTSQSWGDRPEPSSLIPLDLVGEEFLPWKRPSKDYPDRDGQFVLVLPVLDSGVGTT